jgi:uncharacterized protein YndB with AHSA1/START domain
VTTTHDRTVTVEADEDVPIIRIEREFAAPRAAVFRAHVDPELVVRWLGPRDLEMTVDRWDARSGGEFRFVHRRAGEEHWFRGCFHDVVPDELIVQTFAYEAWPESVALERLVLTDLGDGRTRLSVASLTDSFEGRDQWLASGMEEGVTQGYEQLDDLLAGA